MKKINSKEFNAVNFMRKVRDKISKDIEDLNYKEIKEYFVQNRPNIRIIPNVKIQKYS